jgi:hypothetical protein
MKNKAYFLDLFQQLIAIAILISFFIGLIPFAYKEIFYLASGLIVVQLLISLFRLKLINFILESILLILSIFSLIPLLGYIFRGLGLLISILDLSILKNTLIYKKVEVFTRDIKKKKFKKSKKFNSENIKDAEFEEK